MKLRTASLLVLVLGSAIAVWGADPVLGTWKLNVAKSKYNPGPPPKSQTRIYEALPGGMKVTVITINPDGESTSIELPQNLDGKDYPVMGPKWSGGKRPMGPADAIKMTKMDSQTAESILLHGNTVVGTSRRVISADGKTMTITYKGTDLEGDKVDNITVYEKFVE